MMFGQQKEAYCPAITAIEFLEQPFLFIHIRRLAYLVALPPLPRGHHNTVQHNTVHTPEQLQ